MANHYLQFSEVIPNLSPEEEAWLGEQLEEIHVYGDREYAADAVPAELAAAGEPDWVGCRAWRDLEDADEGDVETAGFEFSLHGDRGVPSACGRHLWLHADESGDPNRAAHLVRKFLKRFRPNDSWSLTYAVSCSKPRAGEFGGGGVFVTAERIQLQDAHEFVAHCEAEAAAGNQNGAMRQSAVSNMTGLVRELFSHVDRVGHPQTRPGGTAEYDVLVPIPAELLRRLRAASTGE